MFMHIVTMQVNNNALHRYNFINNSHSMFSQLSKNIIQLLFYFSNLFR